MSILFSFKKKKQKKHDSSRVMIIYYYLSRTTDKREMASCSWYFNKNKLLHVAVRLTLVLLNKLRCQANF